MAENVVVGENITSSKSDRILVFDDFERARVKKRDWVREAIEDYEFALGKQWDGMSVETLRKAGVKALTINKIQPNIFLVSGIQRQNRTDFYAFPEGEEDTLTAEIATHLLKNIMKQSVGDQKLSEIFEDGLICGEGWLEPYIDYTYDLINGAMKLKKLNPLHIFPDPEATEYDFSDGEFMVKFSPGLSKRQLERLFPDKISVIEKVQDGKLQLDKISQDDYIQVEDYPHMDEEGVEETDDSLKREAFDLTEYYYKKYVKRFLVADKVAGTLREADNEEQAKQFVEKVEADRTLAAKEKGEEYEGPTTAIIPRTIPEIWIKAFIGRDKIDEYICQFYPRWKSFPLFGFFAHRITTPIKNRELMVQGIVRSLKDPQRELNKRRTQELRHLNSSTNSGWLSEKGAWVNKTAVKKFGASPGILLEYKKGAQKPDKIYPQPLSQGHAQLAAENANDIKEISGINADLLALNEKTQSGRAIFLRQKQGLVMIQRILDNFQFTKRMLAKFILSQLGELYSVDTATRVVGQRFIKDNFSVPQMREDNPELPVMEETVPGQEPQMKMRVDEDSAGKIFNMVLNDTELGKYDVSVGEGAHSETVKYANYLLLMELAEKGVPIPPDILVEESMLGSQSKAKIKQAVAQAMEEAKNQPPAK